MASASYSFPNHTIGARFSAASPHRVSASSATVDVAPSRKGSLYDALGIETGATPQEIKSAYRRLARVLHPDVVSDSSADEFIRVQAAYATLSDPEKRAAYDGSLRRRALISNGAYGGGRYSAVPRRKSTWETDQCW